MIDEHPVVQGLVPVLQRGQADEALEVVGLAPQVLHLERDLLLDRRDADGKQSAKPEAISLFLGERGVLVQQGVFEQLHADRDRLARRFRFRRFDRLREHRACLPTAAGIGASGALIFRMLGVRTDPHGLPAPARGPEVLGPKEQ
ncbi:MAG TPA: hypothetical protein VFI59_07120 [Actinomycetota bacterium]|nr:hypothetical protein [Actinomycetota bacterium]